MLGNYDTDCIADSEIIENNLGRLAHSEIQEKLYEICWQYRGTEKY